MIMSSIYLIYTGIYLIYIWYISGISHLSWYIPGLCFNSAWWLVLRWWALPHTTWHGPIPPVYMKIHWFRIPSSGIWNRTGIYQVYTTYWALTRTGVAPTQVRLKKSTGGLAFIGFVPCVNTNSTFKHQRHGFNTNGTFRFFQV
jgi:hypothetical protein